MWETRKIAVVAGCSVCVLALGLGLGFGLNSKTKDNGDDNAPGPTEEPVTEGPYEPKPTVLSYKVTAEPNKTTLLFDSKNELSEHILEIYIGKQFNSVGDGSWQTEGETITLSSDAYPDEACIDIDHVVTGPDAMDSEIAHTLKLDGYWYGAQETQPQYYPMDKNSLVELDHKDHPVVPRDRRDFRYLDVLDSHWLNSYGFLVKVDEHTNVPLYTRHAAQSEMTLKAYYDDARKFYRKVDGESELRLKYRVCNYKNSIVETLKNTIYSDVSEWASDIDARMLKTPIWSTWAKFKTQVDESVVLNYANDISLHYANCSTTDCGQMEIDDKWQSGYGSAEFNLTKFPDPTDFVSKLHNMGFRVTLWTTPFINKDTTPAYTEAKQANYFVKNALGRDQTVHWWQCDSILRGCASMIDMSNPNASDWQYNRFQALRDIHGVDGFKFDAGEVEFLQEDWKLFDETLYSTADYNTEYGKFCARFGPLGEMRSAWRLQKIYPGWMRMLDLWSQWGIANGLRSIIPKALTFTLTGYPWVMPDMVGGNVGGAVEEDDRLPNRELYIRWTELASFLPVIQYSIVPWDFPSNTTDTVDVVEVSNNMAALRNKYVFNILDSLRNNSNIAKSGFPVTPTWWLDESAPAFVDGTQFIVGDRLLVAPVLYPGMTRLDDIYLPRGYSWRPINTVTHELEDPIDGGVVSRDVPLDSIALFLRDD